LGIDLKITQVGHHLGCGDINSYRLSFLGKMPQFKARIGTIQRYSFSGLHVKGVTPTYAGRHPPYGELQAGGHDFGSGSGPVGSECQGPGPHHSGTRSFRSGFCRAGTHRYDHAHGSNAGPLPVAGQ